MLETKKISCPYCGEQYYTTIDLSGGAQRYIEDCQVCCRPIEFDLLIDPAGRALALMLKRDDE